MPAPWKAALVLPLALAFLLATLCPAQEPPKPRPAPPKPSPAPAPASDMPKAENLEGVPGYPEGARGVSQARVGDFVQYRYRTDILWLRRPDWSYRTRATVRLTVLAVEKGMLTVGIKVLAYTRTEGRQDMHVSEKGKPPKEPKKPSKAPVDPAVTLLMKGMTIPVELLPGSPKGTAQPGSGPRRQVKSRQLDTAAAGYRWTARFTSVDSRPSDGPLRQTWIAPPHGPLYLTAGLVRLRNELSGYGAGGGHSIELVALGTDPKLAQEAHPLPYFVKGSWCVDEIHPRSKTDKPKPSYLRKTEFKAMARDGAAPFFRTVTRRLPDGRPSVRDRAWGGTFIDSLFLRFARPRRLGLWKESPKPGAHELKPVDGMGGVSLAMPLRVYTYRLAYKGHYDKPRMCMETKSARYAADPMASTLDRCPYALRIRAWLSEETLVIEGGYLNEAKKVVLRTFGP